MSNLSARKRKVDLQTLPKEEVKRIGLEVGKKIGSICNKLEEKMQSVMGKDIEKAKEEINKVLSIYGNEGRLVPLTFQFKKEDGNYGEPVKL